MAQNKNLQIGR